MTHRSGTERLRRPRRATRARRRAPAPPPRADRAAAWLLAATALLCACAPAPRHSEPLTRSAAEGLVYVVADPDDDQRTDLWRARLSDGAVQPLIQTPDRDEAAPIWSESASALALQTRRVGTGSMGPTRLVLWRAGRESELPGERAQQEAWATWSPLDPLLVYAAGGFRAAGEDAVIRTAVALVDLGSGEQRILARGSQGAHYVRPAFSPDGRRVVVQYRASPPPTSRIALLDVRGEPHLLTDEGSLSTRPCFTRDGLHILFSRRPKRRAPRDLMQMKLDGSELHAVASTPESDDFGAYVSPTRDEMVFLSDRDGKQDAFLVALAGGTPRNLTGPLDFEVNAPRWSPNGEYIALTALSREARRSRVSPAMAQVLVIDRQGRLVFRTSGISPDWMPPWG